MDKVKKSADAAGKKFFKFVLTCYYKGIDPILDPLNLNFSQIRYLEL